MYINRKWSDAKFYVCSVRYESFGVKTAWRNDMCVVERFDTRRVAGGA